MLPMYDAVEMQGHVGIDIEIGLCVRWIDFTVTAHTHIAVD
jgi:hypothetical protein